MKKCELLVPAGGERQFIAAVENGADAVYVGGKLFNARINAGNFDDKELTDAVDFAHKRGVKVYVTMNTLIADDEMKKALEYVLFLYEIGVDALIVQDVGLGAVIRENLPDFPLHLSTQGSVYDLRGVQMAGRLGYERVVLARELSFGEIKEICQNTEVEIEVFVHGALCICYSGQCQMSRYFGGRSGNRGECAQPCRLPYKSFDEDGRLVKTFQHPLSPKDLCLIDHIGELAEAGVASLKIEGRMKSAYYIATLIKTYRMLIDEIYAEGGRLSDKRMEWYYNELAKAENRPTGCGFYEGMPTYHAHLYGVNGAGVTQEFIAYVLDYEEESGMATLEVRNNFRGHIAAEVFGPTISATRFELQELYDMDGNLLDVAKTPMQKIRTHVPLRLEKDAMIRKVVTRNRSGIY